MFNFTSEMNFKKKIIGLSLLVSVALKMLMAPIIFANYELRKDFIINNYCVNKNRPEMHCDGKCYLAKQIKKADQDDEKQATNRFISELFSIESISGKPIDVYFSVIPFITKTLSYIYSTNCFYYKAYSSIFHPPQG